MSTRSLGLDDNLYRYLVAHGVRESPLLAELRAETATTPNPNMQISPEQGAFMALLIKLMDARRALEIGVFTGYSSLAVAGAMAADGRLVACDIDAAVTEIAARYWQRAGIAHKIDLRLAPAAETLDGLIAAGEQGRYDFAFIDADKEGYEGYYQRCLELLRPGGVILVDNVLWHGAVADDAAQDATTQALRAFNAARRQDERVDVAMIPVADGLTLLRKR